MKFSLLSIEEIQSFRARLVVIGGVIGLVMATLLFRIWFLQIVDGAYYEEVAKGNRIRVIPQEAPRGIIYDRRGTILAYNRPAFNVQIIPEDTPDLVASLQNLSRLTGQPYAELQHIAQENRSRFKFKPVLLLEDIGRKMADLIDTYQEDLPGISVSVESKRLYPNAFITSHVVGYVGAIDKSQLKKLPLNRVRSGRIVGRAGIELVQNTMLIGLDGGRQIEVDHVGRELRVMGDPVNPIPGIDIYLTIDLRLQQFVKSLMIGKTGVVLVSRPRTGEILAISSIPDFDPNLFVGGIEEEAWQTITEGETKPLVNKATQGIYPPGSTFKMLVAAAGLGLGIIDRDTLYNCPGYFRLGRDIRYCWNRGGHGDINLVEALAQSCNVYFYQLGLEIGVDRLREYALMFGFGNPTGVELESEKAGNLPSKAWKKRVIGERWYDGETIHVAIGQGYLTVTPIQLLNYVNTLANRGVWVQPTLIHRVITPEGVVLVSGDQLPRRTRLLPIPLEGLETIVEGMTLAVNEKRGTAKRARSERFIIAGKTGTSQVVGRRARNRNEDKEDKSLLPHSIFVAFAPVANPQVSVLVLVEHGKSGGQVAAPMAKRVMEYYFAEIEPVQNPDQPETALEGSRLGFRDVLSAAFPPLVQVAAAGGVAP